MRGPESRRIRSVGAGTKLAASQGGSNYGGREAGGLLHRRETGVRIELLPQLVVDACSPAVSNFDGQDRNDVDNVRSDGSGDGIVRHLSTVDDHSASHRAGTESMTFVLDQLTALFVNP